jgi:polyphosphate glucokinase
MRVAARTRPQGRGFAIMTEQATDAVPKTSGKPLRTLAVDIGGTGIKAETLDAQGKPINQRQRIPTPAKATPRNVLSVIGRLAKKCAPFERVSVGFPGVVKDGVTYTAPNLGKGWNNFDLEAKLRKRLARPVRVANDADVQGLGSVRGQGVELVITLGTGVGSVIFVGGHRIHMELGHHPFHKGKTYEQELGIKALKKKGKKKWNKLLAEALDDLANTFQYDRLYIGGGNAREIKFKLPANVKTVSNTEGLLGGIKLWSEEESHRRQRRAKPK